MPMKMSWWPRELSAVLQQIRLCTNLADEIRAWERSGAEILAMHDPHDLQISDGKSKVGGRLPDKLYTVHGDNNLIWPCQCDSFSS